MLVYQRVTRVWFHLTPCGTRESHHKNGSCKLLHILHQSDLSCLRGLGVETSTNPQMEVLRRSMSSVSAVSQSITASHSRSWPVRSLEMRKDSLSSTPWLAPGMWLAAGIPCSIASTARCITSAFRKERNLCWVIWSNLLQLKLLSLKKDSCLAVGSISVYIPSGYDIHSSPWKDPPCY